MIVPEYCVLDTETTGIDPATCAVVEVAIVSPEGMALYRSRVNPGVPIPPEASAVHHITDAHVADAPRLSEIAETVKSIVGSGLIVAHNAPFDSAFMAPIGLTNEWVDSLRFARHLWPHAPGHGNQVLRYWRKLTVDTYGEAPHSALADAAVTAAIFRDEIDDYLRRFQTETWEQVSGYIASPLVIRTMPFGKHKGVELKDLPRDYVQWMAGNLRDLDLDLKASLEHCFPAVRFGA
jgi:exodeoxyribonuclease X